MGLLSRFTDPWSYEMQGGPPPPIFAPSAPGPSPLSAMNAEQRQRELIAQQQQTQTPQFASPGVTGAIGAGSSPFVAPPGFVAPNAGGQQQQPPQQQGGLLSRLGSVFTAPVSGTEQSGQQGGGWLANLGRGLANAGNDPMLMNGLALLGEGQGRGNWGNAARSLMDISAGFDERASREMERRAFKEDRGYLAEDRGRASEEWSWTREERTSALERRRLAQQYIATRPPQEQAELRMINPDQLGSYLQETRRTGLQERQLELQTEEMRNNNRYRSAELSLGRDRLEQDRLANSADSLLGRGEAERINGYMGRLDNWRLVDNDISRIEYWLDRRPDVFNSLLDGDQEQVVARWTRRGDQEALTAVQDLYAIGSSLSREELRGQTPVSNLDFLAALRANPTTASTTQFVRSWLDRAYQDRADMEGRVQDALRYRREHGNLYEADPGTGQSWYESEGYNRYAPGARSGQGGARRSESSEARSAAEALRTRTGGPTSNANGASNLGMAGPFRILRPPRTSNERDMIDQLRSATARGQTRRAQGAETWLRRQGVIQ